MFFNQFDLSTNARFDYFHASNKWKANIILTPNREIRDKVLCHEFSVDRINDL